ncbi:MAG: hypothetical protein KF864_05915 [Phycisphaeraceae bacterium]|nr:hypothetical protein [Phycisphaeraceae bacterium]
MAVTDAIEGTIGSGPRALWFHYDITSDVLYLRLAADRTGDTLAEETDQGFLLLRRATDYMPVGLTVTNWWKRFASGTVPDLLSEIGRLIERWAARVLAFTHPVTFSCQPLLSVNV